MALLKNLIQKLTYETNANPVKSQNVQRGFGDSLPSFSEHLSICEFSEKHNVFLLEDGISLGSAFEIGDIPAESASKEMIESVFKRVLDTFSYVVPLHDENPWIMQIYVNDEFCLEPAFENYKAQIPKKNQDNPYTAAFLERLEDLYEKSVRKEGLFKDPVSGGTFRGRLRRIRATFYRRYNENVSLVNRDEVLREHLQVRNRIKKKLSSAGLDIRLLRGSNFYEWFVRWFNPSPRCTKGNVNTLLKNYPYEKVKNVGSFNFAQNILYANPKTDGAALYFDDLPHKVLFFDGLAKTPEVGAISREMEEPSTKKHFALLDKLHEGSVYTMQIVFSNDSALEKHLNFVAGGVMGGSLEAKQIREDIQVARDEISLGNRLYWISSALYVRAETLQKLDEYEDELLDLFGLDAGMPLSPSKYDFHQVDSYFSALPFNFNYKYFKKYLRYDRLFYASEMASLLPVYGRNKGGKHMGCLPFFNRVGEPVFYDPLHKDFMSQNSHIGIFATSGGGKSVLTGYMIDSLLAHHNARIALFEMGNSFGGLFDYARNKGKKTKQLKFVNDPKKAVAINPFSNWDKAIPEINVIDIVGGSKKKAEKIQKIKESRDQEASLEDKNCDDERSYLNEMALALRTMLTQANKIEEDNFKLSDETLIIEVLSDAIIHSFDQKVPQMLTEHVVQAFERRYQRETSERKKERVEEFKDRLKSYVVGNKARFFNVPTESLDDFDLFHIDVQSIQSDKAMLSLVMISLLPRIIGLAEKNQNSDRPMYLVIDEAHLQLSIPAVLDFLILVAKVARKLGLWLIIITQSISDLQSEQARKIITLCENLILLNLNETEILKASELYPMSEEQKNIARNLRTEKGVLSEAMLLNPKYSGMFRVIPPRRLLAILLTHQNEKKHRSELIEKHGEEKAIELLANELENVSINDDCEDFFIGR